MTSITQNNSPAVQFFRTLFQPQFFERHSLATVNRNSSLTANPAQLELARQKFHQPALTAGLELQELGVAPLFPQILVDTPEAQWWLGRWDLEPLIANGEKLPVTKAALRNLKKLAKNGLTVDELYVAHQLAPQTISRPEELTAAMVRPVATQESQDKAFKAAVAGAKVFERAIKPFVITSKSIAKFGSVVTSDPVLLAAVRLAEVDQAPALWYLLASWDYPIKANS